MLQVITLIIIAGLSAENVFTFTNENNVAVRKEDDNGMEGGNL